MMFFDLMEGMKLGRSVLVFLILSLAFMSGGCSEDRSVFRKDILEHDPSFKETLVRRDSFSSQIREQKNDAQSQVMEIDDAIKALSVKKKKIKSMRDSRIEQIKKRMDPDVRQLQEDLMGFERESRDIRIKLKDVERDIAEIRKLIGKKEELELTQEEIRSWDDKLASLLNKKQEIVYRDTELKERVRITRLKIKVLKL